MLIKEGKEGQNWPCVYSTYDKHMISARCAEFYSRVSVVLPKHVCI